MKREGGVMRYVYNAIGGRKERKDGMSIGIGAKLMIAFMCIGMAPLAVTGYLMLEKSDAALRKQAFAQLEAVREIKKTQIEKYFKESKNDMEALVNTVQSFQEAAFKKLEAVQKLKENHLVEMFEDMQGKLHSLKDDPYLHKAVADMDATFKDGGVDGERWKKAAARYDERFMDLVEDFGWGEVFLINLEGDIIYTVEKQPDLGMSLTGPALADSSLGKAYAYAVDMDANDIASGDFQPYEPANGAQMAFMAAKIEGGGATIGYVACRITADKLNGIMRQRNGLGRSGESFLIGMSDGKRYYRSTPLFDNGGAYKIGEEFAFEYADPAFSGRRGRDIVNDQTGALILVSYRPLYVGEFDWAIVTKVSLEEVIAPRLAGDEKDYFAKYIDKYAYYDLFLVHPKGDIFYTVGHEADYRTNIINGEYSDSGLGKLVRKVIDTGDYGFADFEPYAPSGGDPAGFIAQPVISGGKVSLVVALQLSSEAINGIMQERSGMGETGETYLIGADKLMRSDSYLDPDNHSIKASFANPVKGAVDTEGAREALSGKTGAKVYTDYNGNSVLASYTPVAAGDTTWALLAEMDESEAFAPVNSMQWLMGLIMIVGVFAIAAVSIIISRSLSNPIHKIVEIIRDIAHGDFTRTIDIKSGDEIGVLARSMNEMVANLRNMIQQIGENSRSLSSSSEELSAVSNQLASGSEQTTSQANMVAGATEQMSSNINTMASAVEEMSVNISNVSSGAEQMSKNMESVSSAVEEMTASINEITKNAKDASQVATQAMDMSHSASDTMNALGTAAREIGAVTEVIKRIAEQTNLLALNATIEAASAGEAGKGFAVVANEIKELANQSATAAEDIASKIEGVQGNAKDAVKVIADVSDIISAINESVNVITHSVEQQSLASSNIAANVGEAANGINSIATSIAEVSAGANDVSRNAGEAARGANDVSANIQGVSQAANDSNAGAQQVNTSSGGLARIAGELEAMISKFRVA